MVVEFLQNTLFDYEGLAGIALDAYNLFVFLGGLLLVTLALGKVIKQMISEAEGSQEADIWFTLVNSFKAGSYIVITWSWLCRIRSRTNWYMVVVFPEFTGPCTN